MIEFLTVSSVNADNRKRDVFPVLVVKVWEAPKRTSHGDIIFTQVRYNLKDISFSINIYDFKLGFIYKRI